MKIELEVDDGKLIEEIARQYAEILYDHKNRRGIYSFEGRPMDDLIKERAIKILKSEGGAVDKEVKGLLGDKEFIKGIVEDIIKHKVNEFWKEMIDED